MSEAQQIDIEQIIAEIKRTFGGADQAVSVEPPPIAEAPK